MLVQYINTLVALYGLDTFRGEVFLLNKKEPKFLEELQVRLFFHMKKWNNFMRKIQLKNI